MNLNKKKYKIIFITKQNDKYIYLGKRSIKATTDKIKLSKDKSISINTQSDTITKGLTSYFFIDKVTGKIIHLKNTSSFDFSPKFYNKLLEEQFFLDATSNLDKTTSGFINFANILLGLFAGVPLGLTIGHIVLGGLFPLQT